MKRGGLTDGSRGGDRKSKSPPLRLRSGQALSQKTRQEGHPTVLVMPTRSKAWATRPVAEITDRRNSFAAIHTKPLRSVLLRVPDLQYDLAGLVWCARKHALRLARLRKRQD